MRLILPIAAAATAIGLLVANAASAGTFDFGTYTVTATNSQSQTTNPSATTFADTNTFAGYAGSVTTALAQISGGSLNPGGSTNPGSGFDGSISNYVTATGGDDVTIAFNTNQRYFGTLWGSVDSTNTVSFYENNALLASFTGGQLTASPVGLQPYPANGSFVDFTADNASYDFNKVVLSAAGGAPFETVNYAAASAVPEPATWAMLILGMGALGGVLRRRRIGGLVTA